MRDQLWNMLQELVNDDSDRMSPKEAKFIEDLRRLGNRSLSDKQEVWLESIWNRVFG